MDKTVLEYLEERGIEEQRHQCVNQIVACNQKPVAVRFLVLGCSTNDTPISTRIRAELTSSNWYYLAASCRRECVTTAVRTSPGAKRRGLEYPCRGIVCLHSWHTMLLAMSAVVRWVRRRAFQ